MRYGDNFGAPAIPLRSLPRNPMGVKVKQVRKSPRGTKLSLVGVATTEADRRSMEIQIADDMLLIHTFTFGGWHYIYAGEARCLKCRGKGYNGTFNNEVMCEPCNGSGINLY